MGHRQAATTMLASRRPMCHCTNSDGRLHWLPVPAATASQICRNQLLHHLFLIGHQDKIPIGFIGEQAIHFCFRQQKNIKTVSIRDAVTILFYLM
jgi:hypothetical protein